MVGFGKPGIEEVFGESIGVDILGARERMSEGLVRVGILETEE